MPRGGRRGKEKKKRQKKGKKKQVVITLEGMGEEGIQIHQGGFPLG